MAHIIACFANDSKGVGLHYTSFRDDKRVNVRQGAISREVSARKKFAVKANVEGRVIAHPGCSESQISAACQGIEELSTLLQEASEGVPLGKGFVLELKDGVYYPGPNAYLLNEEV